MIAITCEDADLKAVVQAAVRTRRVSVWYVSGPALARLQAELDCHPGTWGGDPCVFRAAGPRWDVFVNR